MAIHDGNLLTDRSASWKSVVQMVFLDSGTHKVNTCTGTFIDTKRIVTASHCLEKYSEINTTIKIVFFRGSTQFAIIDRKFPEVSVRRLPFDSTTMAGTDIGVIELSSQIFPSQDYGPIPILSEQTPGNISSFEAFYSVGTGANGQTDTGFLNRILHADFQMKYVKVGVLGTQGDLATFQVLNGELCTGDSGGPLLIQSDSGVLYLAGIQSHLQRYHYSNPIKCNAVSNFYLLPKKSVDWLYRR